MQSDKKSGFTIVMFLLFIATQLFSQNPIIRDQFSADPSARVFGAKVYVYPSHDILAKEGQGRPGWFCMADYHVFSSSNLENWTDHGVIVSQDKVDWVDPTGYSMWAPDCIERDGKYYFYFPTRPQKANGPMAMMVGVAVADQPYGPFVPQPEPIANVLGIDPNVFIDSDGQAYLYWSGRGGFFVSKLKDNMLELDSEPQVIDNLPAKGLKEGAWVFERNGTYYLTFPHVENGTERLEYAMGESPTGPFTMTGVIMDESPTGCWTNHHSIIEFNDQWYLFYHHNDLSPYFDKNRSVRIDSLFFNGDGTIRKVVPTLRGVGITDASKQIQIDRYSQKSPQGVSVAFLDTSNTFGGWKAILDGEKSWIQYNSVDFGNGEFKSVNLKALSGSGGNLEIRVDNPDGPVIAHAEIPQGAGWKTVNAPLLEAASGVRNLVVVLQDKGNAEVDWLMFE